MTGDHTPGRESAQSPAVLADLENLSPGAANADSAQPGGGCKRAAPDFSATVVIDTASDAGSYADHIRDTAAMRGAL